MGLACPCVCVEKRRREGLGLDCFQERIWNVWAWTALGMLGLEGFGQKGFGKVWAWTALVGLKVQARKDFGMLGAVFFFVGEMPAASAM